MQTKTLPKTNFMNSERNYESVKQQILFRFGKEAADSYDPFLNCRTYNDWSKNNYTVNKGARSLKSVVMIEGKDKSGKTIKYPKTICLFFKTQVTRNMN